METICQHQSVLMRDSLGIETQVTDAQLQQIKNEQDQKGEEFLLKDVVAVNNENHLIVGLEKG